MRGVALVSIQGALEVQEIEDVHGDADLHAALEVPLVTQVGADVGVPGETLSAAAGQDIRIVVSVNNVAAQVVRRAA